MHTTRRKLILNLAGAAAFAWPALARSQPDPSRKPGPTVADTGSRFYRFEHWTLTSADAERRYRIRLAVPRRSPPRAGFPVIYLLDGNAAFAAIDEARLQALDETANPPVIVALGYDTESRFDTTARAFDYTPPVGPDGTTEDPQGRKGGGADRFLDLVEQRIKPEVAARAPVDLDRQTLWGHSYGGLLVLHTLFSRPQAFRTYIAADPSLWWHHGFLLEREPLAVALPAGAARQLLVMTGDGAAQRDSPARPRPGVDPDVVARMREARRSVPPDAARDLVARQGRRPGLQAHWQGFEGVAHGPMLEASLGPALMVAAGRPITAPRAQPAFFSFGTRPIR